MRVRSRLATFGVAAGVCAVMVATSLVGIRAVAQTGQPAHWGQSPYYPNCVEGPCRVVLIADKTGDARLQGQIQRWVGWMNYARTTYNLNLPAFGYYQLTDPTCAIAPGFISVCRGENLLLQDCPDANEGTIQCNSFTINLATNHFESGRATFRPRELDNADAWTLVCSALGRSVGLGHSEDSNSCMAGTLTLGTGQEKYYTGAEWVALFNRYNHPAGE